MSDNQLNIALDDPRDYLKLFITLDVGFLGLFAAFFREPSTVSNAKSFSILALTFLLAGLWSMLGALSFTLRAKVEEDQILQNRILWKAARCGLLGVTLFNLAVFIVFLLGVFTIRNWPEG